MLRKYWFLKQGRAAHSRDEFVSDEVTEWSSLRNEEGGAIAFSKEKRICFMPFIPSGLSQIISF